MSTPTDPEDRRLALRARRRRLGSREQRNRELDRIRAVDPALHAELTQLRTSSPQAFRKELAAAVKRLSRS